MNNKIKDILIDIAKGLAINTMVISTVVFMWCQI